jgi:hypothetical protein
MTATLKPIETRYKGYRFRSRLEARWAVFFDALGIEWQYEPEGYEKNGIRYLPDFWLPQTQTWVEVKGSDEAMKADGKRLESFLDFDCPLPHFTGCDDDTLGYVARGLLILGEIPDPSLPGCYLHPMIRHHKGLMTRWAWFKPAPYCIEVGHDQLLRFVATLLSEEEMAYEVEWTTRVIHISTVRYFPPVFDAYRAARSARFEHGETPR